MWTLGCGGRRCGHLGVGVGVDIKVRVGGVDIKGVGVGGVDTRVYRGRRCGH